MPKSLRIVRPSKDASASLTEEQRAVLNGGRNRCKDTYHVYNVFYVQATAMLDSFELREELWTKEAAALFVCGVYNAVMVTAHNDLRTR